jgi:GalNAc-alpha-(1->4)-GalNAc-alpha-(1->3)-diNAcBac-PP-undecaprenol alpha-1,4-N-acetyl-D-galactosaminyltransferase
MRLTLVISSLARGGAERTASVLASAWAERGNAVTLITLEQDDVPAYPLHSKVALCQLRIRAGKATHILYGAVRNLKIISVLRDTIRASRPDFVISFMDISNLLALLATRPLAVSTIIVEQVHPAYHYIGWHWEILRRVLYRRADALVCASQPMLSWFESKGIKGLVIPNPVDLGNAPDYSDQHGSKKKAGRIVIGMGRLVEQKGFDLLLEAFSRVAQWNPDWSLKILGDGPLRNRLMAQTQKLNLAERVEFTGALADPFTVLRAADLFVFSSRFEGFGNALCEAMACGLPAISFDCPSGPSEIIRNGVDGVLVPAEDVAALTAAMNRLMSDERERLMLASRAPEVGLRFGIERVLNLWEQILK